MAKIDSLKQQLRTHLDPGEEVVATVIGVYETKILGQDAVRNGIFSATSKRLMFYAKKLFGHDLEVFPYGAISSFEASKDMMGHKVSFFASGNRITMKWINRGDVDLFLTHMRSAIDRSGVTGSRSPQGDASIDLLRKLGELRDAGVLTPKEFEARKKELLARL